MKTTTIKNFGGLTYVSVSKVPIRSTEFGDVIDMEQGELEKLVAVSLIENRVPVRGAEFRVMKSALRLSNDSIADYLGVNRNTVLKWGKEIEKRLPKPYEILVRLLVADLLNIELNATLDDLSANDKAKKINLKAA